MDIVKPAPRCKKCRIYVKSSELTVHSKFDSSPTAMFIPLDKIYQKVTDFRLTLLCLRCHQRDIAEYYHRHPHRESTTGLWGQSIVCIICGKLLSGGFCISLQNVPLCSECDRSLEARAYLDADKDFEEWRLAEGWVWS